MINISRNFNFFRKNKGITEVISQNVKFLCEKNNIQDNELSFRTGLSLKTVTQIKYGLVKKPPNYKALELIANQFSISITDLTSTNSLGSQNIPYKKSKKTIPVLPLSKIRDFNLKRHDYTRSIEVIDLDEKGSYFAVEQDYNEYLNTKSHSGFICIYDINKEPLHNDYALFSGNDKRIPQLKHVLVDQNNNIYLRDAVSDFDDIEYCEDPIFFGTLIMTVLDTKQEKVEQ
ncbi:hypothetical protein L3V86_08365 [Thiotrichales bacterium 19S11-10]|nr:hypothetical protein [Thiotrichales bacterium 19S11-10]